MVCLDLHSWMVPISKLQTIMAKNNKLVTTFLPTINKRIAAIAIIKTLKKVKTLPNMICVYDLFVGFLAVLVLPTLFI